MTPEETLYFLQSARTLARYHQALGIDHYPATAKLSIPAPTSPRSERAIDRKESGKIIQPQAPPYPAPLSPRRERSPSADSEQTEIMATADLVDPQNCRLCSANDIQPLTARTGRVSQAPKLFVVGDYRHDENPGDELIFGKEEDELLAKMLAAIALNHEDVGITNLVKCRPAMGDVIGDGPDDTVAQRCLAHLRRQLLVARPRLILAMGDLPARILTGKKASLSALRGRLHNFFPRENQPVPVLISYHPAFLLAQTEMKKAAWEDLKMARRFLVSLPLTVDPSGR